MATLMDKLIELAGFRIHVNVEYVKGHENFSPPPLAESSLQKMLRTMSGKKPDMTTHFELIGLEPLRRRYDLHWAEIEGKVHLVVRRIIGAHLRDGDSFVRIAGEKYAVTFAQTDKETAKKRAADIRQHILDVFFSNAALGKQIDLRVEAPHPTAPQPRGAFRAAQTKTGQLEQAAAQYRDLAEDIIPQAPQGGPVFYRAQRPKGGMVACGTERAGQRRPVLIRDDNGEAIMPPGIAFRARRIWDLATARASGQRYFFYLVMPDGTELFDYDVLPVDADDDMVAQLDMQMLASATEHLARTAADEMPVKILCPVHYRTVVNPKLRQKYLEACQEMLPEVSRPRLTFELLHMPRALYGAALTDPIAALKKVSRGVIIRCPLDHMAEDTWQSSGAMGVSTHTGDFAGKPVAAVEAKFRAFVRTANKLKLRSYVFGLDSPELCDAAEKTGFGGLCGDGVLAKHPEN
ncbi:MAG: hypothetical protein ACK4PK_06660 [Alphaproteobacteria bacterium]